LSSPLSLGLPIRPLKFQFSVNEGYDSNINATNTNILSGWFTSFSGHATYNFGGPRLQLSAGLDGGVTWYPTIQNQNIQPFGDMFFNATYKALPRLTLTTANLLAYYSQPQLGIPGVAANASNYFNFNDSLAATYQWTHTFSTVTSYSLNTIYYTTSSQNDAAGYVSQTISQSANWLVLPKTTFVLQYQANPVTYYQAPLNSFSNFALIGVNQLFTSRISEQFRIGAQTTNSENGSSGNQFNLTPTFQSTFNCVLGPKSNISWNMGYSTQPSGLAGVSVRQSFSTTFNWTQALTSRIAMNLGVSYQNNSYSATNVIPSGSQNVIGASIGVTYLINRSLSLSTGYTFIDAMSPVEITTPYVRNQISVGANFSF
jgi:hypothetical protein